MSARFWLSSLLWIAVLLALFCIGLSGCATVERGADQVRDFAQEHPVVTSIAAGAAAGAIVVAVDRHHHDRDWRTTAVPPNRGPEVRP